MNIIKRVNKAKVDPKLIADVLEAVAEMRPEDRDFTGTSIEIIKRVADLGLPERQRQDLSVAINFRFQALARLIEDEGGRGWTLPGEPGCTLLHPELIRAAAEEPMIEVDGKVVFDPDSFHRRLLALAEMQGRA